MKTRTKIVHTKHIVRNKSIGLGKLSKIHILTPWMVLLNKSSGNKKDVDGQTLKSSVCSIFG